MEDGMKLLKKKFYILTPNNDVIKGLFSKEVTVSFVLTLLTYDGIAILMIPYFI